MPTFKSFRKLSSKGASEDPSNKGPDATLTSRTKDILLEKPAITGTDLPEYSDVMKEVWSAAKKELPQAHGAENFLNEVGRSIMLVCGGPLLTVTKGRYRAR
jgi:hypothetical protein